MSATAPPAPIATAGAAGAATGGGIASSGPVITASSAGTGAGVMPGAGAGAATATTLSPASPTPSSPARPPKRTSNTCLTCRARKVRCDGRRDVCTNCERLGFGCTYQDAIPSGATGGDAAESSSMTSSAALALSLPRRRVRLACANCHSRKARCSGALPKCDRCRARGIECVYQPGKRSRPTAPGAVGTGTGLVGGGGGGSGLAASAASPDRLAFGNGNGWATTNVARGVGGSGGLDDRLSDHSRSMSSEHDQELRDRELHEHEQDHDHDRGDLTSITSPSNFGPHDGRASSTGAAARAAAAEEEALEAIAPRAFDMFFRYVHHIPVFSFLHRASLMQRYHAGLVDRGLLLALVGITSLLTDLGEGTREYGAKCIDEAEASVLRELDRPSTLKLQTLVLVVKHRILSRRFSSAFMLHAVASRFAAALRLNHENSRLCFLAQESRRRLMWAVYMIDTGIAAGNVDFGLWEPRAPGALRIQLPCNERNFEFDLPETTEPLEPPRPQGPNGAVPPLPDDIGFLALHIRIHLLRSRILQYTKGLLGDNVPPEQIAAIPSRFAELESQLLAFSNRLPVSFGWSEANVRLRAYSPRLCVFLMTHVWWEQCHIDLYRVAAHAGYSRDAISRGVMARVEARHPSFAAICRRQTFEHARAMADMFSLLLTLDNGVPVTDLDLPVCVYQCARMLFLSLQTSAGEFAITAEGVTEMAGVCLKVLNQAITAPAAMSIRADLEKLLANGVTSDLAPSAPGTPDPATGLHRQMRGGVPSSVLGETPSLLPRHNLPPPAMAQPSDQQQQPLSSIQPALSFPTPTTPLSAVPLSVPVPVPMPHAVSLQQHIPNGSAGGAPTPSAYPPTPTPIPGPADFGRPLQPQQQPPDPNSSTPRIHRPTTPTNDDSAPADKSVAGVSNGAQSLHPSNAFDGALDGLDFNMDLFGMDSLSWLSSNQWLGGDFSVQPQPPPSVTHQQVPGPGQEPGPPLG